MSKRSTLLAGAAALALLAGATPAVAQTTLDPSLERATPVAAFDGHALWSTYDATAKAFRLVHSEDGGAPRVLDVPPRALPFDVAVGTNTSGSPYAVYTRCATAPTSDDPDGADCDVYRLGLRTGREERLTAISSPAWDERDPTIMRGSIAFIRREQSSGRLRDVLRLARKAGGPTTALVKADSMYGPQLAASHVAYVTVSEGRYGFGRRAVHVRTLSSGADRVVYDAQSGGANFAYVTPPTVSETLKSFIWARTNNGSGQGNRIIRHGIAKRDLTYAGGSAAISALGWAGGEVGAVYATGAEDLCNEPGVTGCAVRTTGPLTWFADARQVRPLP